MAITVRKLEDAAAFRAAAFPFMLRHEAQHCLGIGIVETLINRPGLYPVAHLWLVEDGAEVVGAAWQTPPHPLGMTAMPDAGVDALLGVVAALPAAPPAVVAPKREADRFRDGWLPLRGARLTHTMEQRIYAARTVTPPAAVPGRLRVAGEADRALLGDWSLAFSVDCGLGSDAAKAREAADMALKLGSRYLWEVGGDVVAMVGWSGQTPNGIRVSWVYTPKALRGKGYASAVVAALTAKLLAEGRQLCFLYTDLANPTSNSIYQKIGYRPVCDSAHHSFG